MRNPSLKSADFHQALGTRPVSRTAHFVLHILSRSVPSPEQRPMDASTPLTEVEDIHVDDISATQWRLGLVLPKKQARRSVTRSLIRHQARASLERHAQAVWDAGHHAQEVSGWVIRLRAPFDKKQFPSAASTALSQAVRAELDELWSRLNRGKTP